MFTKSMIAAAVMAALASVSGASAQATCTSYCAQMETACTGANAQYTNQAECETACNTANWPQGTVDDATGNSLECRAYHAGVAGMMDPATHCPHASFEGSNQCGTLVENFVFYANGCGLSNAINPGALVVAGNLTAGTFGATSGGSLECRLYHQKVAFSLAMANVPSALHCGHAATASVTDVCGTAASGYCAVYMAQCAGEASNRWTTVAECETWAGANMAVNFTGVQADTGVNSLNCRAYHTYAAAALGNDPHCEHASAAGGGACGSYCDNYCDMWFENCESGAGAGYMGYGSRAQCQSTCATWMDGAVNATDGDSKQCRIYHAGVAGYADSTVHCPHASAAGGGVCVAPAATGAMTTGAPAPATTQASSDDSSASSVAAGVVLATGLAAALA